MYVNIVIACTHGHLQQEKAEQVIHASNNKVLTLPSLDGPSPVKTKQQDTTTR